MTGNSMHPMPRSELPDGGREGQRVESRGSAPLARARGYVMGWVLCVLGAFLRPTGLRAETVALWLFDEQTASAAGALVIRMTVAGEVALTTAAEPD